jgi:uncharacterized OsmC-like protein
MRGGLKLYETLVTKLKFLQGYQFIADFDAEGMPKLLLDEQKPAGQNLGPNPTRLLSAAVGHCLSSSLVYCLLKARVKIKNIETTVRTKIARNKEGYLRVEYIEVQISLDVAEEDKSRIPRCKEIFENYCTVTQSVRKGIEVNVNVA